MDSDIQKQLNAALPPVRVQAVVRLPGDGTDRLCRAVYGRPAEPRDYLGGANAQMLYDAADMIEALKPNNHSADRVRK
jgi:hypothetical protein